MQNAAPHISVVIVNYKVKEYIANLLNSLKKAQHDFALEIFVVDNDSGDDSVSYLKQRYPEVNYIANEENVGFGKANNQAIRQANGEFTLIINPDTLVSEDTLDVLVNHMNENPECGAAGCKILNPDGTFAPESRRSIPTIWSASCKVFGLNTLFPESKLFSQYYLSWMGEDEAGEIPVLSGSFMFWRTDLLKELDGFDERFFMYGEDIDLCYRVQKTDYRIDYVPDTSIIHYKGESTKKGDLRYIRIFNKALYQFFDKHYSARYSLFFRIFIYLAIWLKTALSFISTNLKKLKPVFADLILLNLSVALGFLIRYGIKGTNILTPEGTKYLWINLLMTLLFLFSGSLLGMFKKNKESISTALKALSITYAGVVIITFFVRNLAYSRLGLIFGFILGVIFFVSYKLIRANRKDAGNMNRGRLRNSRVILVGDAGQSADIISKIHTRPDWSYEVVGYVNVDEDDEKALGGLTQLRDLVKAYQVDQVFFALNSISYKQMLKEISNLQKEEVVFKLIPDSMDFILGKSNVEYLEAIPLVEVEFEYSKPINRLLKRLLDLGLSVPLFVLLLLVCWPAVLFSRRDWVFVEGIKLYRQIEQNKWKNRLRLLGYVISGKLSLVGAPINESVMEQSSTAKKGVTGLIQISKNRIQQEEEAESFGLYYLQNYSLWMDIDILIKTIFNGPYPLEILSETKKKD
ncbi:glycosyltransferase [Gracilimonas sediminicola]|uniref:Glycosyltransferase n=1 Tax=Gracilimonas sediminicola TaxID=2952158 RepID=A0A9X2RE61_9BACT|nr:glycosyltransferase [Gracilimonas sediminicola]